MKRTSPEAGYTLVEVLIAMALFATVSAGFYQVLFAGVRGGETARNVAQVAEESRSGIDRIVRDTRQADVLTAAGPSSYSIKVDYNGDGQYKNSPGNYEVLTYAYDGKSITLNNEILIGGVKPVPGKDIFTFTSNVLEYDWNSDGVTKWQEIDEAPRYGYAIGNYNGVLDGPELSSISSVNFAFQVTVGNRTKQFFDQAQLRNYR